MLLFLDCATGTSADRIKLTYHALLADVPAYAPLKSPSGKPVCLAIKRPTGHIRSFDPLSEQH
jgi:hypothetical protein